LVRSFFQIKTLFSPFFFTINPFIAVIRKLHLTFLLFVIINFLFFYLKVK